VVPNFEDPYTRGPLFIALSGVAVGFMYLFLIVRFYSKFCTRRKLTWDDLTSTLGALGVTGIFVGLIYLERVGLGTHQWDLPASVLLKDSFLKPLFVLINIVPMVNLFAKLSFFIYFLQIFGAKPILRWNIYIGACITTCFYTATTIAQFVMTTPPPGVSFAEQFATFLGPTESGIVHTILAVGYFNIFSDIYILLLPISGVIRLQLPRRRKVGVILIFMTGLL
jgi:hypothetical protein